VIKKYHKLILLLILILAVGAASRGAGARPLRQVTNSDYLPLFFGPEIDTFYAELTTVATGLRSPVVVTAPDDGSGRLFIVDQIGQIRLLNSNGTLLATPFLDISARMVDLNTPFDERGLLGMALHPDYATNGRFFVYYSAPLRLGGDGVHTNTISEFTVSGNPNLADPNSEKFILQIDFPQNNHNAGDILIGPDGYLYIAVGDGGGGGDDEPGHAEDWYDVNAGGNGQDLEANILGSILRIDVDSGDPYSIPADNPGVSINFPETWAYGFRNPYRMAFDPGGDRALFVGDGGQLLYEEVSIVESGGNYGWNVKEGAHCFSTADPGNPDAITDCPDTTPEGDPLIDPVIEFNNARHPAGGLATVIIGGEVYRGTEMPAWYGNYFFGYFTSSHGTVDGGVLLGLRPENGAGGLWEFKPVAFTNTQGGKLNAFLLGFGQDLEGNMYVLTTGSGGLGETKGKVFRLDPP